ncbi:MAG TPA: sulfurtransferase TusA family protein [Actinomycetota bacterium]|nr:sulfurtransferase TusA family protein [Actinomycetota bacterium]
MTIATQTLDARGLLCPMPIVRATQAIAPLAEGEVLKVLATDRGAIADFPAWAHDTGNELLDSGEENGALFFIVKKGIA